MCSCFYERDSSIYICFSIFNCYIFIIRILSKPEVWVEVPLELGKDTRPQLSLSPLLRTEGTWDLILTPGHTAVLSTPPDVC